MARLTIRCFGDFSAIDHRGNKLSVGRRTQALVIYLALRSGEKPTFAEASRLIFETEDEREVREVARDLEMALRFVGSDLLCVTQDGAGFNEAFVDIDVRRFSEWSGSPSIHRARQAAELYRGSLLARYQSGSEAFDQWLAGQRLLVHGKAIGVFSRLLAAQVKAGWWENAFDTANWLLTLDPTQEVVHRTLMRLQLEQGRPDSALRRYQECCDILRREFGTQPSEETERVHREILATLERTPAPREVRPLPGSRPELVLVVEDDAVSAAILEDFLREDRFEVITVSDGADALMEIARRRFDLLILDINIPTLNGLRLFEIMIQKGIETPAIFITGIPGPEVEAQSLEAGAADFLRKPVRRELFLPRVRAALHRRTRSLAPSGE
jgi:CheY-like chemotaxis protein